MTKRVFNFSAGPAVLPEAVLQAAADEMLNFNNSGMSVMELSHRSSWYQAVIDSAEAGLRKLMNIPENYKVLFLQGGASLQFAMIPMNLMKNKKADYVNTGVWSKKAIAEAKRFGEIKIVGDSSDKTFSYVPELDPSTFTKDADYFHVTPNNTIYGTKLMNVPNTGNVPVIADMSSNILSEEFDMTKYGMIYGGAQKNIGPAGVTFVIIREDLIHDNPEVPTMLNYKTHSDAGSMFNTPPTWGIYILKLVFDHMLKLGGVKYYGELNKKKAKLIYDAIDNSKLFKAHVQAEKDRSLMNIPFFTDSDDLNKKFLKEAEELGMVNLKGHRSVGGMRSSIYNAMPIEGCQKLADFIIKFDNENS
ncbi:MAG: 3-phosphoserine/phosphohydroxythreonine transaminase [Candidatus Delongbacteria bacterium]|jgi:phosphoserine aminotransferase|nr:3-phosphoserine/phosphohydroxythreonine transaminase [Candidatus Delongbacteria bacterium]